MDPHENAEVQRTSGLVFGYVFVRVLVWIHLVWQIGTALQGPDVVHTWAWIVAFGAILVARWLVPETALVDIAYLGLVLVLDRPLARARLTWIVCLSGALEPRQFTRMTRDDVTGLGYALTAFSLTSDTPGSPYFWMLLLHRCLTPIALHVPAVASVPIPSAIWLAWNAFLTGNYLEAMVAILLAVDFFGCLRPAP